MASCCYLISITSFLIFSSFLECSHYQNSLISKGEGTADVKESILCRHCGTDVSYSNHITNHLSPKALVSTNNTLFGKSGVYIQVLTNPLDIQYRLITLSQAYCIGATLTWNTEFSWFPGYAWKGCVCRYCRILIGWMFEPIETATNLQLTPSTSGFYLLIIDRILGEEFANTIIVNPQFHGH